MALGTALLSPQPPGLLCHSIPLFSRIRLTPQSLGPIFPALVHWRFLVAVFWGTGLYMGLRPTWVLVAGLLLEGPGHSSVSTAQTVE